MRLEFKLLPKTAIGRTYHWRGQILLSLDCRSPLRIPSHSIVTPLTHSTCVWLRYSTSSVSHKVTEYLKGYIWILTGPGGCAADPEEATEPGSGLKLTDLPPEILENIFAFLHPGNLTFSWRSCSVSLHSKKLNWIGQKHDWRRSHRRILNLFLP